ncbi:Wilms tumor protein 1-interacting protein homolog [Denticeps clupeoides]|uniref:LIM zinc-binding domain-containing protein n=1 Tax=Denticeps clupeoides TaxID=299321 RepID=A0AAY4ELC0_9TELE|nr:Wilms tumor protein 1-interacting protein homolog [Denticeps clupeoides]
MDHYEDDLGLRAGKIMEDLSLYDAYQDGIFTSRESVDFKPKRMNGSPAPHQQLHGVETYVSGNKVYTVRSANGSRGVPLDLCSPPRDVGYGEDGYCTKSEVALPCYGASDRHRRFSLEVQGQRYSAGCAYDGVVLAKPLPLPGGRSHDARYGATSPRSSLASSLSSQEQSKHSSPRSSVSSPRTSLVVPGGLAHCEGSSVLSPRSSYASTASDTSKHSSPRASLNSYDCGSKPSSNRTSGISMGYDQRHVSPRSSTTSPRSSYSDPRYAPPGGQEADGGARGAGTGIGPNCVASPRSSISSHSSRSSRSSRGSMSAYPDLQLPSPRSSMQEEAAAAAAQDFGDADGPHRGRAHLPAFPAAAEPPPPQLGVMSLELGAGQPASFNYGVSTTNQAAGQRFKLPYQVTPCRENGPSQAERRLDALTLELEKELEMHMKKEYFGICVKCGKGVYGASQACQAMGNLYHTNCFTCCSCGRRLRGKAFYNVNGKVYCEEDFLYSGFQQTAEKCFVCGHLIMEMILQALGKSYHPGCFRCVVCKEGLDGVPFTVDVENNIYCVKDYHTVFAPKCASCNQPILPAQGSEDTIRVVSMDKDYHVECYHCEDCGLQLNDEEGHRCYPLEGHLLCHSCHIRRLKAQVPSHPPPCYPLHVTEL